MTDDPVHQLKYVNALRWLARVIGSFLFDICRLVLC
jgi:hypothetical protein